MSIVCLVILVPTVRDFFFKLVLFTTLNSSQTAGLLLLCDHRIFSWLDQRLQRQPMVHPIWGYILPIKRNWRLLFISLKTLAYSNPNNRGLETSTMKGSVPVLRGEGWIPLVFVEKVGLRADNAEGLSWIRSHFLHSHSWEVETLAWHHILQV